MEPRKWRMSQEPAPSRDVTAAQRAKEWPSALGPAGVEEHGAPARGFPQEPVRPYRPAEFFFPRTATRGNEGGGKGGRES
jgi:hypothetical protein